MIQREAINQFTTKILRKLQWNVRFKRRSTSSKFVMGLILIMILLTIYKSSLIKLHIKKAAWKTSKKLISVNATGHKRILVKSENWDKNWYKKFGEGNEPFLKQGCRVSKCYVTPDSGDFSPSEYDAVVVDVMTEDILGMLGGKRNPNTYFVLWAVERPYNSFELELEKNHLVAAFNLTMSYRSDSDIHVPFFKVQQTKSTGKFKRNYNFAANRTGQAVWFAGKCHTENHREELVDTLKNYISVDVYGECGDLVCSKDTPLKCEQLIKKNYKFYFAFESMLCIDFITEKIVKAYNSDVIPIVYGIGYESMGLPPKSYIDVFDFPSIKALGEYLQYLDRNDKAYNEYFKWKNYYTLTITNMYHSMCDLCEFLYKAEEYEDIGDTSRPFFQPKTLRIPPPKRLPRIAMPTGKRANRFVLTDGSHQRYQNIKLWYSMDICLRPEKYRKILKFIRGENID